MTLDISDITQSAIGTTGTPSGTLGTAAKHVSALIGIGGSYDDGTDLSTGVTNAQIAGEVKPYGFSLPPYSEIEGYGIDAGVNDAARRGGLAVIRYYKMTGFFSGSPESWIDTSPATGTITNPRTGHRCTNVSYEDLNV